MWPFEQGKNYNRRRDIHVRFGGQQQGGIITPQSHPVVIIITGEEGAQHGYTDRMRADGVFEYFGEGQVGDMQFVRGNRAIAEHSTNGRSLLLFRKQGRDGTLRFEGEWLCEAHHREVAPDTEGNQRSAIVFELRSLEALQIAEERTDDRPRVQTALEDLRALAYEAARPAVERRSTLRTVFERSANVRAYILARAASHCEGCESPAPFVRMDGSPYLEPHHLRRVSDGGPDHPRFVIGLCPNCHRRVHASIDGREYNDQLMIRIGRIELKRAHD